MEIVLYYPPIDVALLHVGHAAHCSLLTSWKNVFHFNKFKINMIFFQKVITGSGFGLVKPCDVVQYILLYVFDYLYLETIVSVVSTSRFDRYLYPFIVK